MKREEFFSAGGYYPFIVRSNSLMHKEAIALGIETVKKWLVTNADTAVVKWLDLACGGIPISSIEIMAAFPSVSFEYTGIDINPDQVAQAKTSVEFPENVTSVTINEGNAWDLRELGTKFDIVFSGMNFHHGNVSELYSIACQLKTCLTPQGIIFSHDEYRPSTTDYINRPSVNPEDPAESFRLISDEVLGQTPQFNFPFLEFDPDKQDWRSEFIAMISDYLRSHQAKDEYIEQTSGHIYSRDFAVSVPEIQKIFSAANFVSTQLVPTTNHMLSEFFGFLVFEQEDL